MVNLHWLLYVLAFVCFLLASHPPAGMQIRWEWLAAACLTLTLVI